MRGVCVFLLFWSTAATAKGPAMALLPTATQGVQDDVGQRVDKALERAARSRGAYTVIGANDMIPKLGEAQSLGIQCGAKDAECLIKLGILLEIDHIVATTVAAASDRYAVEAIWIDAKGGREVGRVRSLVDRAGAPFETGVGDVVAALLDSTVPPARLAVTVSEPGAEIRIDGAVVGTSPLQQPLTSLSPGLHKVAVVKEGMRPVERDVLLSAGVPMALDVVMAPEVGAANASSGGAAGSILLWTGAAAAGVGVVGAAAAGAGAFLMNEALIDATKPVEERVGARNTGQALVFAAAAGAFVASIGVGLIGLSFAAQ